MKTYGARLLKTIRSYQRYRNGKGLIHFVLRKIARIRYEFWSVITGSDIDPMFTFGSDLALPHPNGLVFHEDAVVGNNCMIMQQVTLGQTAEGGAPKLGNGVYVGAGAVILGEVTLGDGVRVGARSVVLTDVPAHCTAVGIPARIIRRSPAIVSINDSI